MKPGKPNRPIRQHQRQKKIEGPSKKEKVLGNLVWLSGCIFAVGVFYVCWLLLTGKFSPSSYSNPQALLDIEKSLSSALIVFGIGTWAFAITVMLRWPTSEVPGWVMLFVGMLLFMAMPTILQRMSPDIDFFGLNSPARSLLSLLRAHSAGLLIIGGLRVVLGFILRKPISQMQPASSTSNTSSIVKCESARTITRQCWELLACQKALRDTCRRFKDRVSCWRVKSGCYCDANIAAALMQATKNPKMGSTPERRSAVRARQTAAFLSKQASTKSKEGGCLACALYQEHQRYKFRVVSWLIYPAALLALWFIADFLRHFWVQLDVTLGRWFGNVSLLPSPGTAGQNGAPAVVDTSWIVVIVAGIIMVSILIKLSEYLIFKRGL